MRYALPDLMLRSLITDLARPVEAATLALVRIDECLARSDVVLADGVRARGHLFEAQALAHLGGELASLEDLVLHDAGMDIRAPSTGVVRAARILNQRRSLARRAPEVVLASATLRQLLGVIDEGGAGDANGADGHEGAANISAMASHNAVQTDAVTAPTQHQPPDRLRPRDDLKPWGMPRALSDDDDALWPEDDDQNQNQDDGGGFDALEPLTREGGASMASDGDAADDLAAIDALLARTGASLAAHGLAIPESGPNWLRDSGHDAPARLKAWLAALEETEAAPAVLAAAIALDAWLMLEPTTRGGEVGYALAATVLRQRGLAAHHMPALGLGLRKGHFRWSPHRAQAVRLAGLIEVIDDTARLADADLKRLTLAREVMMRRCEGRRGNSRLGELVDLFMASPLVTVQMAADTLKVTPQAVEAMLKDLGSSLPRELTGRKRYRAWGLV